MRYSIDNETPGKDIPVTGNGICDDIEEVLKYISLAVTVITTALKVITIVKGVLEGMCNESESRSKDQDNT